MKVQSANMSSIHFRNSQDFWGILYNKVDTIFMMENLRNYWKQSKEDWFSHKVIDSWKMVETKYENTANQNFQLLLQYDQLNRHPTSQKNKYENEKRNQFKFATLLAFHMIHNEQYKELLVHERIFTLLAIRHKQNLNLKYYVLQKIKQELEKTELKYIPQWLRFMKATIIDIEHCKKKENAYIQKETLNKEPHVYIRNALSVIQKPVYTKENVTYKELENIKRQLLQVMEDTIPKNEDTIAVSISGGVDSMVASSIVKKLCEKRKIKMILLHICYNNRNECTKELSLLYYWAKILDVPLHIRRIDELTRARDAQYREMYENVTRHIRFSFYEAFHCPIILAHNRDDTFENMFSNLCRRIHFDNLKGMSPVSVESNITLLRPFLTIDKEKLIKYADCNEIPHLVDSTPPWSDRGKARDILMPFIKNYDSQILPGLEDFVEHAQMLHTQWKISFDTWIEKEFPENNRILHNGIKIPRDSFFKNNYKNHMFWIQVWFSLDLPYRPSNRCIKNIIQRIDFYDIQKNQNKISCSIIKNIVLIIKKNVIIIKG